MDDAGRLVSVSPRPKRIVSTLPSVTELIVALGAADRLVARTRYDTDPRIADVPSLGLTLTPSAEAILAFEPELVIGGGDWGARGWPLLESAGLRIYLANVQRTADIYSTARRLGTLLDIPVSADSLIRRLEAGLDTVRRAVAGRPRASVLYLIWPRPPQTAGPGTFIDEVITAAGGRNVFADSPIRWPQISVEEILRRDPDVIVLPQGRSHATPFEMVDGEPGWRDLTAFREGRVVRVESDLFNRPGPRVAEAARTLSRALHPGAWR
ncbi:MAG: ABC transporter substrate-binding protein [Longimicrobiales bacterium]